MFWEYRFIVMKLDYLCISLSMPMRLSITYRCKHATLWWHMLWVVVTNIKTNVTLEQAYNDPIKYQSLVGALQYLTLICPALSYPQILHVNLCTLQHWKHFQLLKRIIRYVQGTSHYELQTKSKDFSLWAFSNADCDGCPDKCRSTSGYCTSLWPNCIPWGSKKQPTLPAHHVKLNLELMCG